MFLVLLPVFCGFSSFFENYFLRLLLITFDLLNEILSLRYQNLSWSLLYMIKKIIFEEYILDVEKIFIKDLNFFVGHLVIQIEKKCINIFLYNIIFFLSKDKNTKNTMFWTAIHIIIHSRFD